MARPQKFTFCPQLIFYPRFLNEDGRIGNRAGGSPLEAMEGLGAALWKLHWEGGGPMDAVGVQKLYESPHPCSSSMWSSQLMCWGACPAALVSPRQLYSDTSSVICHSSLARQVPTWAADASGKKGT